VAFFSINGLNYLAFSTTSNGGSFMDALPDPMRLDLFQVGFVILLLTALYLYLKKFLFKPLLDVMIERESVIQSGTDSRLEVTRKVEASKSVYDKRLQEMRERAYESRRELTKIASQEKQAILEKTRQEAGKERQAALHAIEQQSAIAETQLRAQVDQLSDELARHLLKQA